MKCLFCENPATVHVTETVNKKKRKAHLCEKCARERNLLPAPPGPQINLKALMNLLLTPLQQITPGTIPPPQHTCPACGLSFAAFKVEGRFGCGHDYETFHAVLEPLLERIHRSATHRGKLPTAARHKVEVDELRNRMNAAVAAENYEQAARLRDLLRQKEAEGTPG